jgi:hypothetical protein
MTLNTFVEVGDLKEQIIELTPALPAHSRSADGIDQGSETEFDLLFQKV